MRKRQTRDKEIIEKNVEKLLEKMRVNNDDALYKSDTSNLSEHNHLYTELLKAYVEDFKENSSQKRKNKKIMFWVAIILLLSITIVMVLFIYLTQFALTNDKIEVLEALPGLAAAIATLLGTFMIIPQLITEYLFNKEEEKHLTEIIGKIQDYDRDIREEL